MFFFFCPGYYVISDIYFFINNAENVVPIIARH